MALTNQQYQLIQNLYDKKKSRNQRVEQERFDEICQKIPEYSSLESSISEVAFRTGLQYLDGEEEALQTLRESIKQIRKTQKELLLQNGFPEDFLEPQYDCSDCKDTGFIDGSKCHCFNQMAIRFLYEQSNLEQLISLENFTNLSYEFFQGEDLVHFENAVLQCKNFIENFKINYHNLFFYGTVGTGKSFLSNCVAKEVLEMGYSVLYFSASHLFETLAKYSFNNATKEELTSLYEDIYNCDLLIIDDLGTELTTSFTSSQLFSCLNERNIRKRSTIISTNLSLEELRNRYSDRIFSRIASNYQICKLTGPDIRLMRKRMSNRK